MGYHMSHLPEKYSISGLVKFAKFHLCVKNHVLMKDPIWDTYTPEAILVEFFAHRFVADSTFKSEFEFNMEIGQSVVDEFSEWADKKIAESQKGQSYEDRIDFDPSSVMGE